MVNAFSVRHKIAIIFLVCFSLLLIYSNSNYISFASSQKIEILDVVITEKNSNIIKGNFRLKDLSGGVVGKYVSIVLYKYNGIMGNTIDSVEITLNRRTEESRIIDFKFNAKEKDFFGNYAISIKINDGNGVSKAYKFIKIGEVVEPKVFKMIEFLNDSIDNSNIENKSTYNKVVYFELDEEIKLNLHLKNKSLDNIKAKAKITIFKNSIDGKKMLISENIKNDYLLRANSELNIDVNIPPFELPESYIINISFLNDNKSIISDVYEVNCEYMGEEDKIIKSEVIIEDSMFIYSGIVYFSEFSKETKENLLNVRIFDANNHLIVSKQIEIDTKPGIIKRILNLGYTDEYFDKITIHSELIQDGNLVDSKTIEYESGKNFKGIKLLDIKGNKYEKDIIKLVNKGIIKGFEDQTFRPENQLTRAEFSTIMCYLLEKQSESDKYKDKKIFSDIDEKHWASGFIHIMHESKLIEGYLDNTFKPSNNIKYSEVNTILVKLIEGEDGIDKNLKWPENFDTRAKELGILDNINNITNEYALRGVITRIINNAIKIKNIK